MTHTISDFRFFNFCHGSSLCFSGGRFFWWTDLGSPSGIRNKLITKRKTRHETIGRTQTNPGWTTPKKGPTRGPAPIFCERGSGVNILRNGCFGPAWLGAAWLWFLPLYVFPRFLPPDSFVLFGPFCRNFRDFGKNVCHRPCRGLAPRL